MNVAIWLNMDMASDDKLWFDEACKDWTFWGLSWIFARANWPAPISSGVQRNVLPFTALQTPYLPCFVL